jgi:hypothetical protein
MAATTILEFLHRLRIDQSQDYRSAMRRTVDNAGAVGEKLSRDLVTRSVHVGE